MIAHAGSSYVLADSSKLGKIAVHRVCALTQVTAVITNAENSESVAEAADALAAAGCDLLRAPINPMPEPAPPAALPANSAARQPD
jgi:DeoR family glycerol-3-phosphate regulon repressor